VKGIVQNFTLTEHIEEVRMNEFPQCQIHRKPKTQVCTSCLSLVCLDCCHDANIGHHDHTFKAIKSDYAGIFNEFSELAQCLQGFPNQDNINTIKDLHKEWSNLLLHSYRSEIKKVEKLVEQATKVIQEVGQKHILKIHSLKDRLQKEIDTIVPFPSAKNANLVTVEMKKSLLEAMKPGNITTVQTKLSEFKATIEDLSKTKAFINTYTELMENSNYLKYSFRDPAEVPDSCLLTLHISGPLSLISVDKALICIKNEINGTPVYSNGEVPYEKHFNQLKNFIDKLVAVPDELLK